MLTVFYFLILDNETSLSRQSRTFCLVRPTYYTRASSCRNLKIKVVFRSSERTVRDVLCWGAPLSVFDWTDVSYFSSNFDNKQAFMVTVMVLYAGQENEMNWQFLKDEKL